MTLALQQASSTSSTHSTTTRPLISRLVIVDIAPERMSVAQHQQFDRYLTAMRQVDEARLTSLQLADEMLRKDIPVKKTNSLKIRV